MKVVYGFAREERLSQCVQAFENLSKVKCFSHCEKLEYRDEMNAETEHLSRDQKSILTLQSLSSFIRKLTLTQSFVSRVEL